MSKFKFFIVFGVALLLTVTATTSTQARNYPRVVDHQDEYAHPWGGDENNGGSVGIVTTSIEPDNDNPYQYIDGTKTGVVFGAVKFFWEYIEVLLSSRSSDYQVNNKTTRGGSVTSTSLSGSNNTTPSRYSGKGGQ